MSLKKTTFLILIILMISSCKVSRFVYYNFADITDHKIFPKREISIDPTNLPFQYPVSDNPVEFGYMKFEDQQMPFDEYLEENETVAFLIIKNDTIIYEKYFNDYEESSIVASFSVAKSITSILIGCAIEDGLIKSEFDHIDKYLPELKIDGIHNLSIYDLLQMRSGLKYEESYWNPFGDAANFYYGTDIKKYVNELEFIHEPGTKFHYSSGDAQILGLLLEKVLNGKSISKYLEEKLWIPLGMEYPASWSLDKKEGVEKTFCCLNARARDFAKIGSLYLKEGNWQGKQILPRSWVKKAAVIDTNTTSQWYYSYQWWHTGNEDYFAQGILGQYIYINPKENTVIVGLGKENGEVSWDFLLPNIASAIKR